MHTFVTAIYCLVFFFNDTATTEIYTRSIVGSVRCVQETGIIFLLIISPLKGGDPAAPSGTATLLRLSPPRQPHLRELLPLLVSPPPSGAINSADLTGGVYKVRERIHRVMLTRDYQRFQLHIVELQTIIRTVIGFL
eukprot:TRINITY_DN5392_c0_g1_i2.p2 TRINITY_DN5392_c0_g1~~TRINITY_DN5392_c0_g1_i2.p2  ORF type:complete len:137 (+),score=10.04 TRINITY_DN5392_c0_g1_i2:58-468(+)